MKRVLAIKVRRLGDTVLWTSSLDALVQMGYAVDLLFPRAYEALFCEDPRFSNRFFAEDRSFPKIKYDAALNFHASPSSQNITKKFSAKNHLIHFHSRKPRSGSSTIPIPDLGVPMKATERDLNTVRALGWKGTAPATKLFVSDRRRAPFQPIFEKSSKPWLFLSPESSRPSKEWPLEYYVELAQALKSRFAIGFFAENLAKIHSDPRYEDLLKIAVHIATPTLDSLLGAMTFGSVFIGGDSGPKHIAVALGLKTVTLFGPESIGEWHCYEDHIALQAPVGCRNNDPELPAFSWCSAEYCPLASHACLRLLRPEDVVKVL